MGKGILGQIQSWVGFRALRPAPTPDYRPRNFYDGIGASGLFSEAKSRSPGVFASNVSFDGMVDAMLKAQTKVLSVLTDPIFFNGSLEQLRSVREKAESCVPKGALVLRKDFILTPDAIDESFAWGADTVLLIVKMYPN